jgi:hypothetical protein
MRMTFHNGKRMFHDQDASVPGTTLVRLPIKTHEPLYGSGCVELKFFSQFSAMVCPFGHFCH